jgi:hypothetical protein
MNSNDQVIAVDFEADKVYLRLADGRVVGNPIDWHPWLANATPEQRANVERYALSVYWPDLDDGLDVTEMMKGMPPHLSRTQKTTA